MKKLLFLSALFVIFLSGCGTTFEVYPTVYADGYLFRPTTVPAPDYQTPQMKIQVENWSKHKIRLTVFKDSETANFSLNRGQRELIVVSDYRGGIVKVIAVAYDRKYNRIGEITKKFGPKTENVWVIENKDFQSSARTPRR